MLSSTSAAAPHLHCTTGVAGLSTALGTDEPISTRACNSTLSLCHNGATCLDVSSAVSAKGFFCICMNGFDGEYCERNVDDCIDNECEMGSTCVDGIAKYTCACPPGKLGQHSPIFC
uniref:EGF-like domain-containing protein n=1 Tax=Parascaris equorum TaxID=6256 RepID=A0A914RPT1_PAREQ